jgi:repressor LexA
MSESIKEGLTKRQARLYNWLESFILREGMCPSHQQIAEGLGYGADNVRPVQSLLYYLRAKGYICWDEGKSRSIRLLIKTHETVEISHEAAAIADSLIEPGESRTEVVERAIALCHQFAELDPVALDPTEDQMQEIRQAVSAGGVLVPPDELPPLVCADSEESE